MTPRPQRGYFAVSPDCHRAFWATPAPRKQAALGGKGVRALGTPKTTAAESSFQLLAEVPHYGLFAAVHLSFHRARRL